MKILHVSPSYYPAISFGGPVKSVHLLNKTLVKKGIEVDVFTTNAGLENEKELPLRSWELVDGVNVKYFPYSGYIHYNFSLPLLNSLVKAVRNYDVVHITAVWNFPVLASAYACIKNKIPYIISPRGTIYPDTIALKSPFLKKIYLKVFGNYCLNNASAIHFTSEDEKTQVLENLKISTSSMVIHNGIETKLNGYPLSEEDTSLVFRRNKYILYLGRINKKKGLDLLLNAYAKINKLYPEIKLIVAGPDNDDYKKELLKIVDNYSLFEKVIFTGMLTGKVKEEAYFRAMMFILPSYSENFGMTVPEAMLHRIPVIVTDKVGIFPLIEKYKAGIVISPDVGQLTEAIESLIDDKELKEQLVTNALSLVNDEFNIENITDRFIDFYNSVIKSN